MRNCRGVELTYGELAALAATALDDDVQGFGARGVINWTEVTKAMNVEIGMAAHGHSPREFTGYETAPAVVSPNG